MKQSRPRLVDENEEEISLGPSPLLTSLTQTQLALLAIHDLRRLLCPTQPYLLSQL